MLVVRKNYKVGDKITAKIHKLTDEEALLSRIDIEVKQNLQKLETKFRNKSTITGTVVKAQKNVYLVNIYGIDCIMPKNEVDVDINFDGDTLLDKKIKVKIIDIKKEKRKTVIVVSRRAVIAAELYKEKVKNYQAIKIDAIYEGEVVRVERYGLLVLANNYQGLVPLRKFRIFLFKIFLKLLKLVTR